MKNARFPGLLVFGCAAALGQTVIPTSTLFLTDGDSHRLTIITGSTFVQPAMGQVSYREYPIAVLNQEIFTTGPNVANQPGGVYNLAGNYLRAAGTWIASAGVNFWDGTTDGVNNFAYNYGTGGVYQFGTDWSGGSLLFAFGSSSQYLGITYDVTDNTFWVSGWSTNSVVHLSRTGTTLGTFNASFFSSSLTALALDPADGTLWMGSQGSPGVFAQYTKSGTLLGTHTYAFTDNILGGEFAFTTIPEPASLALLLCGLPVLWLMTSRRRCA
jgi:hypothetical protein